LNILRLNKAELAYGEQKLLHDAFLSLEAGEKVALIGRNGTGKSTLLKVFSGSTELDDGECWKSDGLKISFLSQDLPEQLDQTIFETVQAGLENIGADTAKHTSSDWNTEHKVERIIDQLALPAAQTMRESSGGIRRRAMLAQALVSEPDLLLLDEPTNHLDIPAIDTLQKLLQASPATLVLVSHDRTMVNQVATRIVELERGALTSYPGNFSTYLARREKADEEEAVTNRKFDQELANEEVWIRQGIKARRTRNEGRVRRLEALRKERAARLSKQGNVKLKLDAGQQSGNIVAELENVSFGYDKPLIKDFSTQITRGDRIGIIGANGSGKSTLIRLILGELSPTAGKITRGTKLQIAYFDQQRSLLDTNQTVRNSVSEGSDHVEIGGKTKHVAGYLADFLFPSSYLNMPAAKLSGGEKNRLLMAKLFAQPANMLVLDEPTNDLDVETLELFEELLAEFTGTILLVSHDRAFIDAVATSTIVFEANGSLTEYVGGYTDWQRQIRPAKDTGKLQSAAANSSGKSKREQRLGYKAQRELDALPEKIEQLESARDEVQTLVMASDFYKQPEPQVKTTLAQLQSLNDDVDAAYTRWEELSEPT
jgi:ATP-binding cassette subfamily F protein uup